MAPTPYKFHSASMRPLEPPSDPKMRTWNQLPAMESKHYHFDPKMHNLEAREQKLYNLEPQYQNLEPRPLQYGGRYHVEAKRQSGPVNLESGAKLQRPLEPKGGQFVDGRKSKYLGQKGGDGGGGEYTAEEPISRTYQYRKVMKPMLERKRRARINRCLDELKELMVTALQSEGENVSKLEKADILELTVRHLHNLKRNQLLVLPPQNADLAPGNYAERFRAGFTQCAQEVTQFITAPSEVVDPVAGRKLLQHLGACVRQLECISIQQMEQLSSRDAPVDKSEVKGPMWRPW